jgi:xylono-1,5-lactonase
MNTRGMPSAVECVWAVGAMLGEGPMWSAAEDCVWFVDIKRHKIHRFEPATLSTRSWDAPAQPGFIVPRAGGGFIAGLKTGLHRFDHGPGRFELMATIEDPALENRLNDAHVDSLGRLWFGTMHDAEQSLTGALYCLDHRGAVRRVDSGYCITNGPAISPDGRSLYHTDTLKRVIYAFDLGDEGGLSNKRVFTTIDPGGGYPDGLSVDAGGGVWIALFGGWGIRCYSPRGELINRVRLPCANVTKAAFGGTDGRTLYITSARKGLSAAELTAQPLAGGLFALRVDTPGLPQYSVADAPCKIRFMGGAN